MPRQSFFTITFDSTFRTKRVPGRRAMELKRLQSPCCGWVVPRDRRE